MTNPGKKPQAASADMLLDQGGKTVDRLFSSYYCTPLQSKCQYGEVSPAPSALPSVMSQTLNHQESRNTSIINKHNRKTFAEESQERIDLQAKKSFSAERTKDASGPSPSFRQCKACLDDVIGSARDPCFVRLGPLARILGKRRVGTDFCLAQTVVGV